MAVCFRAPPLRNRARASVTMSRSSRYRLAGTPRMRAVAAGVGKGVVITARGLEVMAPLYTTVAYARRLAQNPGGAQPAHIGGGLMRRSQVIK